MQIVAIFTKQASLECIDDSLYAVQQLQSAALVPINLRDKKDNAGRAHVADAREEVPADVLAETMSLREPLHDPAETPGGTAMPMSANADLAEIAASSGLVCMARKQFDVCPVIGKEGMGDVISALDKKHTYLILNSSQYAVHLVGVCLLLTWCRSERRLLL